MHFTFKTIVSVHKKCRKTHTSSSIRVTQSVSCRLLGVTKTCVLYVAPWKCTKRAAICLQPEIISNCSFARLRRGVDALLERCQRRKCRFLHLEFTRGTAASAIVFPRLVAACPRFYDLCVFSTMTREDSTIGVEVIANWLGNLQSESIWWWSEIIHTVTLLFPHFLILVGHFPTCRRRQPWRNVVQNVGQHRTGRIC